MNGIYDRSIDMSSKRTTHSTLKGIDFANYEPLSKEIGILLIIMMFMVIVMVIRKQQQ